MKTEVILKYKNRKLYSKSKHCYVSLKYLLEMRKNKIEFMVVDNETKTDITTETIFTAVCRQMSPEEQKVVVNNYFSQTGF